LVGAPAVNWTSSLLSFVWNEQALWRSPGSNIPHHKLPMIQQAALASCQASAGVINGVAADPRYCSFDPESLLCDGPDHKDCLTQFQVSALEKIYQGPESESLGAKRFHGPEATFEAEKNWWNWIVSENPNSGFQYQFASGFLKDLVFGQEDIDIYRQDFSEIVKSLTRTKIKGQSLSAILDADNPDLQAFRDHGGKMLMYFGWADLIIYPRSGINYYQNVIAKMGGLEATKQFYHLYMVPGLSHCNYGPGANAFGQELRADRPPALQYDAEHNILLALQSWVENNNIPERITAAKYIEDDPEKGVAFTRPMCSYPNKPIFMGRGSPELAYNYECSN